RSYDVFAQCAACGRAYWRGAHHEQRRSPADGSG
ncbi:Mut7-C RNAse domain-containing protein, partial [Streptomyces sp. NPDC048188]